MSTFLATTALDEFWQKDAEEILFLGSWCLRHDRRERWANLRYRVLPSPWDDRERFAAAVDYVDQVGERLLPALTDYLNGVHGERYSLRYWRVLIGQWLMNTIHALYDRFEHLRGASALEPFTTLGLEVAAYRVPATAVEQVIWLGEDLYNLQLFTQLLEALGHDLPRRRPVSLEQRLSAEPSRFRADRVIANAFEAALRQCARSIARRSPIALYDMYANRPQRLGLALRSAGRVIPLQSTPHLIRAQAVFDERRLKLSRLSSADAFERILVTLLPHLMPIAYLEGYRELIAAGEQIPRTDVIASANGWYCNESMKLVAAEASERGAKLVAIQHGGGYGVYRHAPMETYEKRIADRFLVWGWASQDPGKLRNVPAANLSSICRRVHPRRDTNRFLDVLFLATAHPRYLFRFHSAPVGSQWDEYFDWETRFFRSVSDGVSKHLIYRGYLHDYEQDVEQRVFSALQPIRRDLTATGTAALLRSRIAVIDHCATGYLEALAMNVPTILFWNPARWEIRREAQPHFEAMKESKILFYTPEEAADHLSAIYERPQTWWWGDEVQNTRRRFVSKFAMVERRWERAWTEALLAEAKGASSTGRVAETLQD